MADGRSLLSDLVHYRTYAKVKSNGKKETRAEVITRVKEMHQLKFPWLETEIGSIFEPVYEGLAVPSMRSMQFGGVPIFRSNARIFNCAAAAITSWKDFADLFWLLMNGVGVGYSVQQRHISQLSAIAEPRDELFVIPDTKEGWADALLKLLENPGLKFDTREIRPKGAPLSTGGTCSGPESLGIMLENVRVTILRAVGRHLSSLECSDIMCYAANIVSVGNVRRAATIALFDPDDEVMLTSKHGEWWEDNPQRARANISAVLHRDDPAFEQKLQTILQRCFDSNCGEPGISLTSDYEHIWNPCHEVALRHRQMCNLTEVNAAACETKTQLLRAVESATAIGTLQASYTQFEYLHPDWQRNVEEEALLGVSITGQANHWGLLSSENLEAAALFAVLVNQRWALLLDINSSARITTTKPSGTTSAWWGTTSGIHAAHADFFLRRVRVDRNDSFGRFLIDRYGEHPANSGNFIESDVFNSENIVVAIPLNMDGAITRQNESAVDLMNRAKHIYEHWVKPGHISGPNTHNVSLTVAYRPDEVNQISKWMLDNKDFWAGISLLPEDGGTYQQMPFEELTPRDYDGWVRRVPDYIPFHEIDFSDQVDKRLLEFGCAGGACEVV